MAVYKGAQAPKNFYKGATLVKRVYKGTVKVWQAWIAARGNVTVNLAGAGTNWLDVSNFAAADPDTAVSGSPPAIVVQGTKTGAQVTVQANVSGGTAPDSRVRILVNGSVVATSGANGSSFSYSWTGNLADGNTVRFQYYGEGAFLQRPTLQNTSYLTVA